ncbi:MAG TPA: hypothetical protein VFD73_07210, partial [Gemmatimonadales bacterium]|nr:hypothetical protein [Gemmatimonadales bacterium]
MRPRAVVGRRLMLLPIAEMAFAAAQIACAPGGASVPPLSATLAEQHDLQLPGPTSHQVPSPQEGVMVGGRPGETSDSLPQ